jgi:electron transport complex protein RnfC
MKGVTQKMRIASLAEASVFHVPLTRYFGSNPRPLVSVGESVLKYQLIGADTEGLPLKTHSPVSGTVSAIDEYVLADHTKAAIIRITNDFRETGAALPLLQYEKHSPETLLERIDAAGVVGHGGAQFPTAVKYRGIEREADTFIINGAECEPYLTADYSLMTQRTEQFFKGIHIANRILKAKNVVIAIEKQNEPLQQAFSPFLCQKAYANYRLLVLPNTYPQGSELQLIRSVTGRELPRNLRPSDVGMVVSNVGTIYAIYDAVVHGKPVISRMVTVSGEEAGQYGNFEVKIGTPIHHLLEKLEISPAGKRLVLGGPMMGWPVSDLSMPITKGAGGLLILPLNTPKRKNCISCGYCIKACPMRLMPMKYDELHRKGKYALMEKYNLFNCIECAACEYVCPSNVPLMESIRTGKSHLRKKEYAG